MSGNVVHLDHVPLIPWKNGGGTTRELLVWPQATGWVCRVSVAEVAANGPFSRFDGVQRWFAVLAGAGVQLRMDTPTAAHTHTLTRHSAPLCFDGALLTQCDLLDGPTQDFNLMLRHNQATGHLQRVQGNFCVTTFAPKIVAVYAISTGATARFGINSWQLPPNSLAWQVVPADTPVQLDAADALYLEVALCP